MMEAEESLELTIQDDELLFLEESTTETQENKQTEEPNVDKEENHEGISDSKNDIIGNNNQNGDSGSQRASLEKNIKLTENGIESPDCNSSKRMDDVLLGITNIDEDELIYDSDDEMNETKWGEENDANLPAQNTNIGAAAPEESSSDSRSQNLSRGPSSELAEKESEINDKSEAENGGDKVNECHQSGYANEQDDPDRLQKKRKFVPITFDGSYGKSLEKKTRFSSVDSNKEEGQSSDKPIAAEAQTLQSSMYDNLLPPGEEPVLPSGEKPVLPPGEEPILPPGEKPVLPPGDEPLLPPGEEPVQSSTSAQPVSSVTSSISQFSASSYYQANTSAMSNQYYYPNYTNQLYYNTYPANQGYQDNNVSAQQNYWSSAYQTMPGVVQAPPQTNSETLAQSAVQMGMHGKNYSTPHASSYVAPQYSAGNTSVQNSTSTDPPATVISKPPKLSLVNKPEPSADHPNCIEILNFPSAKGGIATQFVKAVRNSLQVMEVKYDSSFQGKNNCSIIIQFGHDYLAKRAFRVVQALTINGTKLVVRYCGYFILTETTSTSEVTDGVKFMTNLTKELRTAKIDYAWDLASVLPGVKTPSSGTKSATADKLPQKKDEGDFGVFDLSGEIWVPIKIKEGKKEQTYYYNARTGESTWSKPKGDNLKILTQKQGDSGKFDLSGEIWVETKTGEGRRYYYNAITRETSWSKPKGNNIKILSQQKNRSEFSDMRCLIDISLGSSAISLAKKNVFDENRLEKHAKAIDLPKQAPPRRKSAPERPKDSKSIVANIRHLSHKHIQLKQNIEKQLEKIHKGTDAKDAFSAPATDDNFFDQNFHIIKVETGCYHLTSQTANVIYSISNAVRKKSADGSYFKVRDEFDALLLLKVLSSVRFIDTKLTVTSVGKPVTLRPISPSKINEAMDTMTKALSCQNRSNLERLRQKFKKMLNLSTYKVNDCPAKASCPHQNSCIKWHHPNERRRNPFKIKYKPVMCPAYTRICPLGLKCSNAHTNYEVIMHPSMYPVRICDLKDCIGFCCNGHLNTPDVFFSEHWKDLYVTGLHNTFTFFMGALRMLYKVEKKSRVPVLLITLSADVAQSLVSLMSLVTSDTTDKKFDHLLIVDGEEKPQDAQVIVGVLPGLLKFVKKHSTSPLAHLKALIVDDLPEMVNDKNNLQDIVSLLLLLQSAIKDPDSLNKVVTAHEVVQKYVTVGNEVLSTKLTVVNGYEGRLKISSNLEPTWIVEERELPPPSSLRDTDKSGHLYEPIKNQKPRLLSMKEQLESSLQSYSSEAGPSGFSSGVNPDHGSHQKSNSSNEAPHSSQKTSTTAARTEESTDRKSSMLAKQFLDEKTAIDKELDAEYAVYNDMPEMHPSYETMIEDFSAIFFRHPLGEGDDIWVSFYRKELQKLRAAEWEKKKEALVKKYKSSFKNENKNISTSLISSLPSSSSTSSSLENVEVPQSTSDNHAFVKEIQDYDRAFALLESLSTEIGVIGVSLREIIKEARLAGSSTPAAMSLFANKNNALILSLSIDQFKEIIPKCDTRSKKKVFGEAVSIASYLLSKPKSTPENIQKSAFITPTSDLTNIAKLTLGKSPNEIVSIIKQSVEMQLRDNRDVINDIYLKISAIHFEMATNPSTSSNVQASTPEPKPAVSLKEASEDTTGDESGTWFVNKVKRIVANPRLTIKLFNEELNSLFQHIPTGYKFGQLDMRLANELKELSNLELSETMFLFTLRKITEHI